MIPRKSRSIGVAGLALATAACGGVATFDPPSGAGAGTDATAEGTSVRVGPPCAVPDGADPRVGVAVPARGFGCVRDPSPLEGPRGVIEARDGSIYVTEWLAGRVQRWTDAGFVPVASGLDHPIGVREMNDGRLLVTEEGAHALARIDPASGRVDRLAVGLDEPTDVALTESGDALVSTFADFDHPGRVRRVRRATIVASGSVLADAGLDVPPADDRATGIYVPEGLYVDATGALLVAAWTTSGGGAAGPGKVLRFPSGGGDARDATVVASGFDHVYGVAPALGGGILVGAIGPTGDRLLRVRDGVTETLLTGLRVPTGITVTRGGDVLVLEGVSLAHDAVGYLIRLRPVR